MAEAARAGGALTIALTNTAGSPLAASVATTPSTSWPGAEKSVAATKSFVNSARRRPGAAGALDGDDANCWPRCTACRSISHDAVDCDWTALGARSTRRDVAVHPRPRARRSAIANEAALKFKETCGMHAEAYSAAEVMHGPLALVGPGFPVLALAARDASEASVAEAADSAGRQGRAGLRHLATCRSSAATLPFAATGHPLTDPLALIVSFYGFVEAFARHRGLDPTSRAICAR